MFLDPRPASGSKVDRGGAAKPGPMKIFEHSPPDLGALEDADHQNAIALPPPKSHIKSYCINRFRAVFADKEY
jgi:hypothetical protein